MEDARRPAQPVRRPRRARRGRLGAEALGRLVMSLELSIATSDGTLQAPAASARPAPPVALVIFGASGDLTQRKLIPALFDQYSGGHLSKSFAVIGYSRSPLTNEQFRERA